MDAVALGRWQFAITTVYHFFFVPITIALSMLVAVLQTFWVRTGNDQYLKLTKFFGKLFLINFALGVVTGIVQEFQFGMNWSEYSRFVGDVFGAPLALEALLAFFLESTFIGLWIFGWDKLPKKVHLTTIYMAAIGTLLSSIFILAANSWMQNPVGTVYNNGRAELDGIGGFFEVLVNPVMLATFPHVIATAYMVTGALMVGVAGWHLARASQHNYSEEDTKAYRFATRMGAWVLIVASVFAVLSGDVLGKMMTVDQPAKLAAAEGALEDTSDFSLVRFSDLSGEEVYFELKVPGVLGFIAGKDEIKGVDTIRKEFAEQGILNYDGEKNKLQEQYADELATKVAEMQAAGYDIDPIPSIVVSYWTFRLMIGMGLLGTLIGLYVLWVTRKGRAPKPSKLWTTLMIAAPLLPLFAISFGWIFTEMGRQPWIVYGVMPTQLGISPTVSVAEVALTMVLYTLIYGGLAVIEVSLFWKYAKAGLPDVKPVEIRTDDDAPMSFAY